MLLFAIQYIFVVYGVRLLCVVLDFGSRLLSLLISIGRLDLPIVVFCYFVKGY